MTTLLAALLVIAARMQGRAAFWRLWEILVRPAALRTENKIPLALRDLHMELCHVKGLPVCADDAISGCPHLDLVLESATIDEQVHLHFRHAPWANAPDDF